MVNGIGDILFDISRPMIGIITTPINVGGSNDNPVSNGVNPNTLCANTGYTNTEVNKPRPATKVKMVVKA